MKNIIEIEGKPKDITYNTEDALHTITLKLECKGHKYRPNVTMPVHIERSDDVQYLKARDRLTYALSVRGHLEQRNRKLVVVADNVIAHGFSSHLQEKVFNDTSE